MSISGGCAHSQSPHHVHGFYLPAGTVHCTASTILLKVPGPTRVLPTRNVISATETVSEVRQLTAFSSEIDSGIKRMTCQVQESIQKLSRLIENVR